MSGKYIVLGESALFDNDGLVLFPIVISWLFTSDGIRFTAIQGTSTYDY